MDINNTSDDILKFALDNGRVFTTHGDKEKLAFVGRERAVHQAMLTMCGATPPLFKQRGGNFIYDLTGDGESFANEGGYAGQRQREQEKRIAEADDRQLARLVSESTMEVNKSIVEINKSIDKTNISVQKTNDSVTTLNSRTDKVYDIQIGLGVVTIIVAIAAVAISVLDYKTNDTSGKLLERLSQSEDTLSKTRNQLDSLKILLLNEREKNRTITPKYTVTK